MKTKFWIIGLAVLLIVCAGLSIWLLRPTEAASVEVWAEGKLLRTLSLSEDTSFTIISDTSTNTIEVKNGKIAVTSANCPDQYCVKRGWCSGGAQIVCLPHKLILKFTEESTVDGVAG